MIKLYQFGGDSFISVQQTRNGVDITLDFYDANGDLKPGVYTYEGLKSETLKRIKESYFSEDITQWIRIANKLQISQNDIDVANATRASVEANRAQHMESVVFTEPDGQQSTEPVSKDYYTYKNGYFTTWTYDGTISFQDFKKNIDGKDRGIMDSNEARDKAHELMRRGVSGGNIHRFARMFGLDPKNYIQPERILAHFIHTEGVESESRYVGVTKPAVNGNNIDVDFIETIRNSNYSVVEETGKKIRVTARNLNKMQLQLLRDNGNPRKIKDGEQIRVRVILQPSEENYE